jgi:hypothetical protein
MSNLKLTLLFLLLIPAIRNSAQRQWGASIDYRQGYMPATGSPMFALNVKPHVQLMAWQQEEVFSRYSFMGTASLVFQRWRSRPNAEISE